MSTTDRHANHGHASHDHVHRWDVRALVRAARHLWSSDVNTAAVALLDPAPDAHVLDLGAGLGPGTRELARRLGPRARITAVDPSRMMRMVQGARHLGHRTTTVLRRRPDQRPPIDIRAGTGEALPLGGGSVDGVIGLNVLHHLDDLATTMAEVARVLRPGGRVVLADEDFGNPDHALWAMADHDHGGAFEPVDGDEVARLLVDAGLADATAVYASLGGQPACIVTGTRR